MKKSLLIFLSLITFKSCYSQEIAVRRAKFLFVETRLMNTLYWVQYPSSNFDRFPINPIQVRLGYQISPRIAIQIGLSGRKSTDKSTVRGTDSLGNLVTEGTKSIRQFIDMPILAKYTFSDLDKKLQFYWLGGFTFVFARATSTFVDTNGSEITRNEKLSDHATNAFACLAIGTSYRFSKHWAIDIELGLNRNVKYLVTSGLPTGSSMGIGVVYAFR